MAYLLDTSVAIHLRDGDVATTDRVAALDGAVLMSVVTRVELEEGVYRDPVHAGVRRARLDAMLGAIPTLAFDDAAAYAYGTIVAHAGYSRRKLLDRMIAAQALVHRGTLVTMNADDSRTSRGCGSSGGEARPGTAATSWRSGSRRPPPPDARTSRPARWTWSPR